MKIKPLVWYYYQHIDEYSTKLMLPLTSIVYDIERENGDYIARWSSDREGKELVRCLALETAKHICQTHFEALLKEFVLED